MCKKILLVMSLVLALSLGASGAWGALNNIPDTTFVQMFTAGSPDFPAVWKDVIGSTNPFQTFNATFDTNTHVLTIFTNWDPTKSFSIGVPGVPDFVTADLFLNPVFNATTHKVTGALAAVTLGNAIGDNTGTVFYTPTFQTSFDIFHTFAVSYGGNFNTEDQSTNPDPSHVFDVPVKATGGLSTGSATVTWTANPSDPFPIPATQPGGPPLFSFAIDLDQIAGLDPGNGFDFLWGTSTCGNDVITPLPPTLLLLGSGLLGLGVLRLRRK